MNYRQKKEKNSGELHRSDLQQYCKIKLPQTKESHTHTDTRGTQHNS